MLKSRKKILIADDSELNREMLTEILGDEYDYAYAEDGDKTLTILSENSDIDILLLDMNMPHVNGMNVLKVMRERSWLDEVPVVIISAENDVNFIKNAYYLGATDYIVRPFNAFLVQHRVENTLTMYSQKKELVRMVENQVVHREKINNMLINIFSHIVEMKNNESGSHTMNVQTVTNMLLHRLMMITDKYPLSEADISMISSVSALHDIGKLTIPDDILNKPGRLTAEEWETMKTHTTNGSEFLKSIPIDQNEPLVQTAHEICLYHHERYDGKGYPEGLCGDDIPISAQVVSLADVYDALTSERCYKQAYSHQTAVHMILGGECGCFNPLLLQAFSEIADELYVNVHINAGKFNSSYNSYALTSELLKHKPLHSSNLAEGEKIKKEFFADRCQGIQFEYDAVMRKLAYIKFYNKKGERFFLNGHASQLISSADWDELKRRVALATRENPIIEMNVLVPINGDSRWQKLTVRTIWLESASSYVGIVGQFTDIHEKIVDLQRILLVNDNEISGHTIVGMRDIFDIVRVVNPDTNDVLKTDENGDLIITGQKCYDTWCRHEACQNCIAFKACKSSKWMSKLETKDGLIYSVLSKPLVYDGTDLILEVALCLDDSFGKTHNEIGFLPDSLTLKNFFRDTLTKTYSRAYLESFMANIEHAKGIAIADIDNFKQINDTYGHLVGDAALKHISKIIKSNMRKEDVLIRYGGDEFLLIFDNISEEDFFEKLKHIKEAVNTSAFEEYPNIIHSISIGGAYDIQPFDKAIDIADKEMYKDKFDSKNYRR